jgi:hypothetical protein
MLCEVCNLITDIDFIIDSENKFSKDEDSDICVNRDNEMQYVLR